MRAVARWARWLTRPGRRVLVEPAVLRAAQRGDAVALRAVFDRCSAPVMSYCLLACGRDRERAKDLSQEIFARTFRSLGSLGGLERFEAWLFTIARNVCRSRGGEEQRRSAFLARLEVAEELTSPEDPPEQREARIAAVQRFLVTVKDPTLRSIVQLKYGEPEHTTREIARALGIPHGTVTVKLMRFREAVRQELWRAVVQSEENEVPR